MKDEYSSFVAKRGSIEVLLELDKGTQSFNQLKSLNLSPNTVLNRLREAQRLGLVKPLLLSSEKRIRIRYGLSEDGRNLVSKFHVAASRYLKLQRQISKLSEEKKRAFKRIALELVRS